MKKIIFPIFVSLLFSTLFTSEVFSYETELRSMAYTAYKEKNYEKAFNLYYKLANRGDTEAQMCLGILYQFGEGILQNSTEAAKWVDLSAEKGDAEAEFNLGTIYYQGKCVNANYDQGVEWLKSSAKKGHSEAQYYLGSAYYVNKNYAESFKFLKSAAENGHLDAQRYIGVMYFTGKGVKQNIISSYMWLSISSSTGNTESIEFRNTISKTMTQDQIEKGKIKARECQDKKFKGCT
jgi:hypothetical protein